MSRQPKTARHLREVTQIKNRDPSRKKQLGRNTIEGEENFKNSLISDIGRDSTSIN